MSVPLWGRIRGSACEENLTARNGISPTLRKACFLLMWLIDCSLFLIVTNTSSWIWPLWSKATLLREFKFIPALWSPEQVVTQFPMHCLSSVESCIARLSPRLGRWAGEGQS